MRLRSQLKTPTDVSLASALLRVYSEFTSRVNQLQRAPHGMSAADARADAMRRLADLCSPKGAPYGVTKVIAMINDGSLWKTHAPTAS